jgi:hypothetical protein
MSEALSTYRRAYTASARCGIRIPQPWCLVRGRPSPHPERPPWGCYESFRTTPSIHTPSLPGRAHAPRRLALFPLLPELPGCGRTPVGPGDSRDLGNHPEVVPEVRASRCPSTPAPASQTRRYVAPGRGVADEQWGPALPLAGRRSGWPCPGSSGPQPSKPAGGEEGFPPAAAGLDRRAAGAHHRQAQQRRGRDAGDAAWGGAPPTPGPQ